tara:strand:+ start:184 stop:1635 length:1452 start_codon:yes stop_codon:yes gene_type:complete
MSINYYKTALLHHSKGNWNKAKEIYEHILKTDPNNYLVLQNYGPLLSQLKEYKLAKNVFEKSLKIKPQDPLLLYNYGKFYHDQKFFDEAIKFYEKSFKIEPKNNLSMYNIGNIYFALNKLDLAISAYRGSLKKNPKNFLAHNNLANALKNTGNFEEAIQYYKSSLKLKNDYPDIHLNYSTQLLMLENFREGFEEYEWRKKSESFLDYINYKKLNLKSNEWKGEKLNNKKLLVISEQGIGDLIQFTRYLFELKKEKVKIIIYLKSKKFSHFFDNKTFDIIFEGNDIPDHDYHVHLLSILKIFNDRNKLFIRPVNFFQKNEKIQIKWNKLLLNHTGIKIGINCNTSLLKKNIPIEFFIDLASNFNFKFIMLQKNFISRKVKKSNNILFFKEMDSSNDAFIDSIEIIKQLDLVITSDTSIAHLSATLGKKTWIVLPFVSDWRWFQDKKKTKWYENVTLYKSKKIDDWDNPFKEIKLDLKNKFSKKI